VADPVAAPSRLSLWLQLVGGVVAEGGILYVLFTHGVPGGLAAAELMAVPMFLLVLVIGRAAGRLQRREHR
jgi:hypothetical protein